MTYLARHSPLALVVVALACGGGGKTTEGDTGSSTGGSTGGGVTTGAPTTGADITTGGGSGESSGTPGTSTGAPETTGPGTTTASGTTTTTTTTDATTGMTGTTGPMTSGATDSASSSGGDVCSAQGESCAVRGELCCAGLECCAGVPVPPGKEFCSDNCPISDRNLKTDFTAIDPADVLRRVVALPITSWRYRKDAPQVRHVGPMAQDFHAAFGLWDSDTMIFPLDASGVSMAAIQALHTRLVAAEAENEELRARLERLERRLDAR